MTNMSDRTEARWEGWKQRALNAEIAHRLQAEDNASLRAEVERLRHATHPFALDHLRVLEERDALRAEVERLRSAITQIQQWDMLTAPASHDDSWSDLPWLKRLVDDALAGAA